MTSSVAAVVRARRARIARCFLDARGGDPDRVRSEQAAESVGVLLDDLAAALEDDVAPESARSQGAREEAARLGHQRFQLGDDLATVVADYDLLRVLLFEQVAEAGVTPTVDEARVICGHLVGAIGDAATRHARERDQLVKAQSAKHLGFLAHELRNPLSSIGMAFALLQSKGLLPPDQPCVRVVERGLHSVTALIDDALINASLEGGGELQLRDIDVPELIVSLIEEALPQAQHKRVRLTWACEVHDCYADYRYLRSALSNLIRNAVKFTRPDTVVRVAARTLGQGIVIEVEDACGGIAPQDIERLFDPFVQRGADRSGFGLGLAIAKQAMDAHQGSLRARSLPERGCVFTLELPTGEATSRVRSARMTA
jgi:signal transduction histidine kinase